MPIKIIEQS